jgi:acetylornithine/N-succinyldiaminopimelate aminotransferase
MNNLISTYPPFPFSVTHAEGCYIFDSNGNKYLDLYGGHCVSLLGHNPKKIIEAIKKQADEIYFYSMAADIPIRYTAAEKLANYTPKHLNKFFFCNSGAEANENALKLCIQKKSRKKLAAFKNGWHGRSLFCMSVTDDKKWHDSLHGWNGPVEFLEFNNIEDLKKIDESIAGVIIEPIQSIGGVETATSEFLVALRKQCTKAGAWLIFDEIQTGLGRTGNPFISESCGVNPDMMTLAKGLASGFPLGALCCSDEVVDTLKTGDLGSTFGGSPLAMAGLVASIDEIQSRKIHTHAKEIGEYAKQQLTNLPFVKRVKGLGLLLGIEFDVPAKQIQTKLMEEKILTGTSGFPSVMRIMPPLIIDKSHIDQLVLALKHCFKLF